MNSLQHINIYQKWKKDMKRIAGILQFVEPARRRTPIPLPRASRNNRASVSNRQLWLQNSYITDMSIMCHHLQSCTGGVWWTHLISSCPVCSCFTRGWEASAEQDLPEGHPESTVHREEHEWIKNHRCFGQQLRDFRFASGYHVTTLESCNEADDAVRRPAEKESGDRHHSHAHQVHLVGSSSGSHGSNDHFLAKKSGKCNDVLD